MQIIVSIGLFFIGAILASFTGVVAERIHTGQAWWQGRSRCNSCRRTLNGFDLVPVFSWLFSGGRCRTCHSKIPFTYVAFELVLGVLFVASYWWIGLVLALPVFLGFLVVLDFIVIYDLRHTIVPVWSVVVLTALALVFAYLHTQIISGIVVALIAAICIASGFLLLHFGTRGRAMGLGDAPVAFALSLAVGFPMSLAGLVFSFWVGAVIGMALLLVRRGRTTMKSEVPFVPFLAIGYLLAFFTGWNPFFLTF